MDHEPRRPARWGRSSAERTVPDGRYVKRVAHLLWRSQGGIRRHVRTIASHPPCGWETAGVWGPADQSRYFEGIPFRPVSLPQMLRATPDADVVHAHGVSAGLVALRRRRPPVVVSLHVVVGGSGRTARSRTARALARVVAARADAVVAVSSAAADGFKHARVVPPAFEPLAPPSRDRVETRSELGARPNDTVVVTVGRLDAVKRLDLFITAIEAAGCVGWLVGDGSDRERLEALARGSRVRMLGYRDDVTEILAAADVFATPSASESYGIAVAEAIGAGLPVVATRTGALEELIGAAGVVVDPGDDDAFVDAVRRLVEHPDEQARLAAAARSIGKPDRDVLIAELGAVYDDVAAKARI